MRELLDTAQYMPVAGRFKVYIIDEVHMLSRHAFNSMLKTLEEPPEHVKFILATTDPQRLPVTVLSRCLQFNLKPLTPPLIAGHLRHVLEAEGIPFEEAALAQLGRAAAGSVRDSLSLLDQAIAYGGGRVEAQPVAEMLGSLGGDLLWPLLEQVVAGDGKRLIAEADRIAERSVSFDAALEELAAILHRIALAQAGAPPDDDEPDAARVIEMASRLDAGRIQVMYQVALLGRRDLPLAPDEYAGFTMALLRMLSFGQGAPAQRTPASSDGATTRTPAEVAAREGASAASATRASRPSAPAASAPRAATPSAQSADAQAASPAVEFNGDWHALVQRLNGLARMVAAHAELASYSNGHFEIVLPEAQRMYADKSYQDKLRADLATHFGSGVRLSVRVGSTSGNSVAAARSREMAQKQASAAEAIEEDPFVRDLVRDLGAEVVSSTIRPAEDGNQTNEQR
ncbi:MAG TPA: DNA polymerase III subunit gamma/tau C-terminal domain-containing protein [Steroidobacteraceae bacterium]